MFRPRAAFAPVRAPAMAMDVPAAQVALPLPAGLTGSPPLETSTSLPALSTGSRALIAKAPVEDPLPELAVEPLDAAALVELLVSADLEPQAANVKVAMATRTTADRIERRCTSHLRRFCSPDRWPVRRRRRHAGTYPTNGASHGIALRS